ncbi:MAG TPA: hypothetical protein VMS56_01280 [Thermoanaerobaculia bacterium]|nr:hypothetical protein [Thermoanaerobaculia bacterium]
MEARRSRIIAAVLLAFGLVVLALLLTRPDPAPALPPPRPLAGAEPETVPPPRPAIEAIGSGTAIVFTPDLALPGNRRFYEGLGFVYFEASDWREVARSIARANVLSPGRPIDGVVLETHGTNGHGLKLQRSKDPGDLRSYISIGGLQETLEKAGVGRAYVSACNAGRLFRPGIYRELDREPGDPLFLPPTLGIVNASRGFDPEASAVRLLRRKDSHLETLMHGSSVELGSCSRAAIERDGGEVRFVISTMLIQILTEDARLELTDQGWVAERSRHDFTPAEAEELFRRFAAWLEARACEANQGTVLAENAKRAR